jgi:hypothetical protein
MSHRLGKITYITIIILLLIFVGTEITLRIAGFGSFPVYDVTDKGVLYIPSANQSGIFMNKYHWAFNDRHMNNAANWDPDKHPDVLLIGNSVVLGGNPYDQNDRLGASLERALHGAYTVWSVATGGWTSINEMAYFDANPDILKHNNVVVIQYMEGNLSRAALWPGPTSFPDRKPSLLSVYWFDKHILPMLRRMAPVNEFGNLPPFGDPDPIQLERFKQFVTGISKNSRVLIFLYPHKKVLDDPERWQQITAPITALCTSLSVPCIDIAKQEQWGPDLYADGTHPSREGIKALAGILAENILRLNETGKM